jgi:hypothetical protein
VEEEFRYTHIGIATIILIILAAVLTAYVVNSALDSIAGPVPGPVPVGIGLLVVGIFVFALAAFYSFTIQIAGGELNIWFGIGVGKKSFAINDIRSNELVKMPWYYFWGIKSIPGSWMYSIAPGGKALELDFMDGGKIRLGIHRSTKIVKKIEALMRVST